MLKRLNIFRLMMKKSLLVMAMHATMIMAVREEIIDCMLLAKTTVGRTEKAALYTTLQVDIHSEML